MTKHLHDKDIHKDERTDTGSDRVTDELMDRRTDIVQQIQYNNHTILKLNTGAQSDVLPKLPTQRFTFLFSPLNYNPLDTTTTTTPTSTTTTNSNDNDKNDTDDDDNNNDDVPQVKKL